MPQGASQQQNPQIASQPAGAFMSQNQAELQPLFSQQTDLRGERAKRKKVPLQLEFSQASKDTCLLLALYLNSMRRIHGMTKQELSQLSEVLQKAIEGVVGYMDPNVREEIKEEREKGIIDRERKILAELKGKGYLELVGKLPSGKYFLTQKGSAKIREILLQWNIKILPHGDSVELIYEDINYEAEEEGQKSRTKERTITLRVEDRTSLAVQERELLELIESRPPISLEEYTSVDQNEVLQLLGPSQNSLFMPEERSLDRGMLFSQSYPQTQPSFGSGLEQDREQEDYEILLCVDNREVRNQKDRDYVVNNLRIKKVNVQRRMLPLGDMLWIARKDGVEVCLDYILERKTADDFAASIVDGRYHQQKQRLQRCGIAQRFYLLEGAQTNGQISHKNLQTAARNTQIFGGLRILYTRSLQESLRLLMRMHKLIKERYATTDWRTLRRDNQTYGEFEKTMSKSSLTIQQLFGRMLRVIPGCSSKNALALSSIFPTPAVLYKAYQKCTDKSRRQNLLIVAKCLFLKEEMSWERAVQYSGKEMTRVMKESVVQLSSRHFDSRYFTMPSKSLCDTFQKLYYN